MPACPNANDFDTESSNVPVIVLLQTKVDFEAAINRYPPNQEGFTLAVILLHPRITGYVRLNSTDPLDNPIINPRYLENSKDLYDYAEGTMIY